MSLPEVIQPSELDSSESSLVTMHPVASGDNVSSGFKSAHRLKEAPALVPCCEGRELEINEELIQSGLSAISVKHQTVLECISLTKVAAIASFPQTVTAALGLVKHRNSFRSLHRPDLRRVPCLRKMAPQELESLFRGYNNVSAPGTKRPGSPAVTTPPPVDGLSDPHGEECVRVMLPTQDEPQSAPKSRDEPAVGPINGGSTECSTSLRPIPESGSPSAEPSSSVLSAALPSGMRLHGTRGRLYTSVQGAAARAPPGDRRHGASSIECELRQNFDIESQESQSAHEELHIILSPRPEDQLLSDPSSTTANLNHSIEP